MANARLIEIDWAAAAALHDIMIFTVRTSATGMVGVYYPISGAPPNSSQAGSGQNPDGGVLMPVPGTFDLLYVNGTSNATTQAQLFTLSKNDVLSNITVSIGVGTKAASDLTHTLHCVAGDWISYRGDAGNNTNMGVIRATIRFTPD